MPTQLKTYLTPEEITAMIDSAEYLRDKVILAFYADTGCRASELLAIQVDNVDLAQKIVLIPHLKRGVHRVCPQCSKKAGRNTRFCAKCGTDLQQIIPSGVEDRKRIISIGEDTAQLVADYIAEARPEGSLISLSRQAIYNIIRTAAKKIGLEGKCILNPETGKRHYVHPHNFRDSIAVSWLTMAEGDITKQRALQEHLGHQQFETTLRYHKLSPVAVQGVADEVRKARFGNGKDNTPESTESGEPTG